MLLASRYTYLNVECKTDEVLVLEFHLAFVLLLICADIEGLF